jgi:ribosomal protein L14
MRSNFTFPRFVGLLIISFFLSPLIFRNNAVLGQTPTGTAAGVPTFQCIGITWSGSGGNANTTCNVQYKVTGTSTWSNGYPLSFDSRAHNANDIAGYQSVVRPANEYRGSIVGLQPGTSYDVLLTAGTASNSFTVSTWAETSAWPIGSTTTVSNTNQTLNISVSGTANGYKLYTPAAGQTATIDVANGSANCIYINASYIIIRGLNIKGAAQDAILLGPNAHDVLIERNDISGWGTIGMNFDDQSAVRVRGFSYNGYGITRIVIQRNLIHDSRETTNLGWDANMRHPNGPTGINFEEAGGNNVFRYNEVYGSDDQHYFNDGIGGADNFTKSGFPRENTDIYGNKISRCWDDGIESEGSNCNVRIWGNFLDNTFTGVACAANSVGPMYIYRNVTYVARRLGIGTSNGTLDTEDRGPFNKCGSNTPAANGGRTYLFHNTILEPTQAGFNNPRGLDGGVVDNGGVLQNAVSRNNIWQSAYSGQGGVGVGEYQSGSGTNCTYDYDLWNFGPNLNKGTAGSHVMLGTPTYAIGNIVAPLGYNAGPRADGYNLAATSRGYNAGLVLPGFNDSYIGTAPDVGAYEAGAPPLQFGVNAYTTPPGNRPPVVNAGNDITMTLPVNYATLSGSATDPDGNNMTIAWTQKSGPPNFTLGTANNLASTLTNLIVGTYVFTLTATDDSGAVASDDVTVTVNVALNLPPTVNAGSDITLTLPTNSTALLGSASDVDGSIASYAWSLVTGPPNYTLGTPNNVSTTLSNLTAGTYTFRLLVTDNQGATAADNVRVIVNAAPNQAPTANAGSDITLTLPVNSTSLSGIGSDADGTITGYAWAWVSGSPTPYNLGTPNQAGTSLSGLIAGTYTFRLTVTDNGGATAADYITVTVNPAPNQPPTANAGNNITLTLPVNSTMLTGSGSDADGTITSYAWTWQSGSPTPYNLGTPNNAITSLSGLVAGTYTFRLTVTDNKGTTGTDDIIVVVNPAPNQAPTANAGTNITITLPTNSTMLVGSGSDPDGTIASYVWTWVNGSPTPYNLGTPNQAITTLSNLVQGVYTFRLTVTDNKGATASDEVAVTVNAIAPSNQAPIAVAGNNITLNLPTNFTNLNGNASSDPDGTIASYAWSWVNGPPTYNISSPGSAIAGLSGLVPGTYTFKLTVTDNNGATDEDNITVIVTAIANQPPVANAGNNITLTLPVNSTNLNGGSSTDPDGTILTYAWSWASGETTYTIANPGLPATGLSGLVAGTYVFRLTVTDNNGASSTDEVTVTVIAAPNLPPTANAGSDVTMTLPINSTILTGSGYDPDGTITKYAWTEVNGPPTFTIVNPAAPVTGLNGLVQGTYTFKLTVTDNKGATSTDVVTVIVNPANNQAPTANAGSDITMTLPINSTILTGSGYDPDGTITKYAWTESSGPQTFTIVNPAGAATGLNGLVVGTYIFKLTITDNSGASATDIVTIIVKAAAPPPPNQSPIAGTENDITITLPVNSTQVRGNTSYDPDGVIVAYLWTQLSGPAQAVISNGNTSIATVSGLTTGIYTFQLKVTDNSGATSTKTMKVTVKNPSGVQPPIFILSPNPTTSMVTMQFTQNKNGLFKMAIYDANRRLMRSETINKTQTTISKTINVSSYAAGVYFIEMTSPDNEKSVKQFVKM